MWNAEGETPVELFENKILIRTFDAEGDENASSVIRNLIVYTAQSM